MIARRHPRRWGQCLSPWLSPPDDTESKPLITMARFVSRSLRQDLTIHFFAHSQENNWGLLTYFGKYLPLAKRCIGHRVLQRADGLVRTAMRLRFAHAGIPEEHSASALLTDPHVFW